MIRWLVLSEFGLANDFPCNVAQKQEEDMNYFSFFFLHGAIDLFEKGVIGIKDKLRCRTEEIAKQKQAQVYCETKYCCGSEEKGHEAF